MHRGDYDTISSLAFLDNPLEATQNNFSNNCYETT